MKMKAMKIGKKIKSSVTFSIEEAEQSLGKLFPDSEIVIDYTKRFRYEDLFKIDPYIYDLLQVALAYHLEGVNKGDKVELTEWAKQNGISKKHLTGTVSSTPKKIGGVKVLPDGLKTPSFYWSGFWKKSK